MGDTKQMTEEYERKYEAAKQIALATGVLKECEYHKGLFFKGDNELNKTFKMANNYYSQGRYIHEFRDKKEMTDTVIEVVGKYSSKKCSSCGHSYEE